MEPIKVVSVEKLDYYDSKLRSEIIEPLAKHGGTVSTLIMGTYVCSNSYLPSCCVKVNDLIYTFDAPINDYAIANSSNIGIARVFDYVNNVELTEKRKEIEVGHANSCCSDGTYIYIAPVFDYSTGARSSYKAILQYDLDLNFVKKIPTETHMMGVTYDGGNVYAYGYDNKLYKFVDGAFDEYATINLPNNGPFSAYNQDIALRNGVLNISTPTGLITRFENKDGVYTPTFSRYLTAVDIQGTYWMGELEGFEYTTDGHLICTRYTTVGNSKYAFVAEIPDDVPMYRLTGFATNMSNGTFTISDSTINTFKNYKHEIKSLEALSCSYEKPQRVYIENDYYEENVNLRTSLIINTNSNATLSLGHITVTGCTVSIGEGNFIFTEPQPINVIRSGELKLNSLATINFTSDTDKITIFVGSDRTRVVIDNAIVSNLTKPLYVGDTQVLNGGEFIGGVYHSEINGKVIDMGEQLVSSGLTTEGITTLSFTFSKKFDVVPRVYLTFYSNSTNNNMAQVQLTVHSITKTGFKVNIYNASTSAFKPVVYWLAVSK